MTDELESSIASLAGYLRACGIEFMIVGSIAALAHGRARSTHDCDLVIEADRDRLVALCRALPTARFYVSEDAALEALRGRTQFNVLDLDTGWKLDLIPRKPRPFSVAEFARRESRRLWGGEFPVASLEDTIVSKLEWSKSAGGSSRQIEDVVELVATATSLDLAYVEHWVDALGLEAQWRAVQAASAV